MPGQLQSHFIDIQNKLVKSEIWKTDSNIELVSLMCATSSDGDYLLLKQILQETVYQLNKLSTSFKLMDIISDQIFRVVKCLICF